MTWRLGVLYCCNVGSQLLLLVILGHNQGGGLRIFCRCLFALSVPLFVCWVGFGIGNTIFVVMCLGLHVLIQSNRDHHCHMAPMQSRVVSGPVEGHADIERHTASITLSQQFVQPISFARAPCLVSVFL